MFRKNLGEEMYSSEFFDIRVVHQNREVKKNTLVFFDFSPQNPKVCQVEDPRSSPLSSDKSHQVEEPFGFFSCRLFFKEPPYISSQEKNGIPDLWNHLYR
jgi:hypothetical protein